MRYREMNPRCDLQVMSLMKPITVKIVFLTGLRQFFDIFVGFANYLGNVGKNHKENFQQQQFYIECLINNNQVLFDNVINEHPHFAMLSFPYHLD